MKMFKAEPGNKSMYDNRKGFTYWRLISEG